MHTSQKQRRFFEGLVRDHSAELYGYAHRFCGDPEMAEDLVADTFTAAWRGLNSLRHRERARAWLYGILRNHCSRWLRDKLRRSESPIDDQGTVMEPESIPDVLDSLALQDHLQTLLSRIEPRYREPFLMVFLAGFSCKETAAELDLPLGTVLSRIHRARKALRREVANLAVADDGSVSRSDKPSNIRTIGGRQ
ncbi:MAG: sigma-70 family RNA polymerase sigma factor [bacterium]|nr:sigma-70 family RNA polymerase sigma factor [bacterium]